jgi:hypothetical protein
MPSEAFSRQPCGGLNFWDEVLRIVELLLVLSFVLVDDILEDGLDAGIDLTWWPMTSAMGREATYLRSPGHLICAVPLILWIGVNGTFRLNSTP